ncbi:MAG: acetoin utilization protein AcuC [Acidobacteria bacterium]|nr:MAG: acetoin utilization protein AcuC [Acidobacteriota bacterium]
MSEKKSAFIYTDEFAQYSYGSHHPMRPIRLKLTRDLLAAYGILDRPDVLLVEPQPASQEDVASFHHPDYIQALGRAERGDVPPMAFIYGLGPGDNPIFPGVYRYSLLITGATLEGARLVNEGQVPIAFNIAGGLHHAMPNRASGFCYFNDPVIAIKKLIGQGRRVLYLDVDVHHGDGVQAGFYDTDRVMTISLHEDGQFLFPGTGFVEEMGEGAGLGYSINVPFYPGTDDETYLWAFDQVVPPLVQAFQPDILVTQLGVDTFVDDPLAHLRITTYGFCQILERIASWSIPWLALGGGGYHLANVARAWTLAFALMNDVDLPDEIPPSCLQELKQYGLRGNRLRDPEPTQISDQRVRRHAEQSVTAIQQKIFPLHQVSV